MLISIYWDVAGPVGRFLDTALAVLVGRLRYAVPLILIMGAVMVFTGMIGENRGDDKKPRLRFGWVEVMGGFIFLLGLCAAFSVGGDVETMFQAEVIKSGEGLSGPVSPGRC